MTLRAAVSRAWTQAGGSSSFIRQVSETYLTQIFLVALGFVNSVLVTRLLGPDGRGLFAAATTFAAIGMQLGNLGLHASNTYFVAQNPALLPVLIGNSVAVAGVCGAAALAGLGMLHLQPGLAPVGGALLVLAVAAVPIGLVNLLLQNLLIGTQNIHTYNVVDVTTRTLGVVLIAVVAPLGLASPAVLFGLSLVTVAASAVWCFRCLRSIAGRPVVASLGALRAGLSYGSRAYAGSLFSFLVLKSDVLLVSYMRGARETGFYAIAVGLADMLLILPTVVGTVLFPRLAAVTTVAERWQQTRRVLRVALPVVPLVLLVILAIARPFIRLAYGAAFDPSFAAVAWLLPGLGCLAINIILMNLFGACGQPPIVVYSPFVALVLNLSANLVLVPRLGFVGASISSTVAYAAMLVMSALYVRFRLLRPARP